MFFKHQKMNRTIDKIDCQIINELQKNARISINHLSKIVNLSGPAVARRIQQLEDSGIILGYHAHIDSSKLGTGIRGYIIVSVQKLELKKFLQYIEPIEEIISCETIIAGGKELIMQIACKDTEHLMKLYDKLPYSFIEDMTALLTMEPANKKTIIPVDTDICS